MAVTLQEFLQWNAEARYRYTLEDPYHATDLWEELVVKVREMANSFPQEHLTDDDTTTYYECAFCHSQQDWDENVPHWKDCHVLTFRSDLPILEEEE